MKEGTRKGLLSKLRRVFRGDAKVSSRASVTERSFKDFVSFKREFTDETLQRYWSYAKAFLDWLGEQDINEKTLGRYNAILRRKYRKNTRIVKNSAINWLLEMVNARDREGEPLRLRIPTKEITPHGRLVSDNEYQRILRYARTSLNLREHVLVRLLRETLLRPSDIVRIRIQNMDLESDPPAIRNLVQKKTGFMSCPQMTAETGKLIRGYLKSYKPGEYLFEPRPGERFHRRWPTDTLKRITDALGIPGITSRTFRATGATDWAGSVRTLQLQGGWKDPKTIYDHYLKYRETAHIKDFKATFEKPKEEVDDAGYFA